jgi:hypothetical protein
MEADCALDKDLHDDMLKLVRYKVMFVRREYEVAFPEQEDLVSDNLDGNSFTAWKVAEFIQELQKRKTPVPAKWHDKGYPENPGPPAPPNQYEDGGILLGLPPEDKKYLRVYYQVLDRYPREKFKYEEQQIRILEEIRNKLGAPGGSAGKSGPDPFEDLGKRLDANTMRLRYLRLGFQACAQKLGTDIFNAYEKYKDYGEFPAPPAITEASLQKAFAQGLHSKFSSAGMESFPGKWKGVNHLYDFKTKAEIPTGEPPWFMTWEKGKETSDLYLQHVVGSQEKHYTSDALPPLSQRKVDLALNVWRKDVGITGWLTTWVLFPTEMALISYEIEQGCFLWIGQVLTRDLQIPPNSDNLFQIFLEWIVPAQKHYYMYGLGFNISFDECSATVVTSSPIPNLPVGVRKSRFDLVE